MNKIFFSILFSFLTIQCFSIGIVEIFYLLPMGIDLDHKKQLVDFYYKETSKKNETDRLPENCNDMIRIIDQSNGYMELIVNCGDSRIELCYWKLENKEKRIAVNHYEYATSKYTESITFYLLKEDSKLITLQSDQIIPYEQIKKKLINEKLSRMATEDNLLNNKSIIYTLPRKGKKIKASFAWDPDDDIPDCLLKQKYCELIWKHKQLVICKKQGHLH